MITTKPLRKSCQWRQERAQTEVLKVTIKNVDFLEFSSIPEVTESFKVGSPVQEDTNGKN